MTTRVTRESEQRLLVSESDSVTVSAANLTNFDLEPTESTNYLGLDRIRRTPLVKLLQFSPDSDLTELLSDLIAPSSSPFSFSRVKFLLSAMVSLLLRTLVSD